MNPDDIPTDITKLTYSEKKHLLADRIPVFSQNQTATLLAHYWPKIEAHIREQVAKDLYTLRFPAPPGSTLYQTGWDDAVAEAIEIVRKETE